MNVNSFGRVVAYLALLYRMNISEADVMHEAVRLVAPILRDTNIIRVEEESFIRRIFSGIGRVLYEWCISQNYYHNHKTLKQGFKRVRVGDYVME